MDAEEAMRSVRLMFTQDPLYTQTMKDRPTYKHKKGHTKSITAAAAISALFECVCIKSCGYKVIGQAVARQSSFV